MLGDRGASCLGVRLIKVPKSKDESSEGRKGLRVRRRGRLRSVVHRDR